MAMGVIEDGNPTQVFKIPKGDTKFSLIPLESFLSYMQGNDLSLSETFCTNA